MQRYKYSNNMYSITYACDFKIYTHYTVQSVIISIEVN